MCVRIRRTGPQMIPPARQCVIGPPLLPRAIRQCLSRVGDARNHDSDGLLAVTAREASTTGFFSSCGFPHHPVVPKNAANRERRQIRRSKRLAKKGNSRSNRARCADCSVRTAKTANLFLPIGICEIAGPRNFRIPAAADHAVILFVRHVKTRSRAARKSCVKMMSQFE